MKIYRLNLSRRARLPLADQLICPVCRATYAAGKRQCAQDRAGLVPNLVGRRVAGRLITDVLGLGDVSAVYRTRHNALGREEVLKVLQSSIDLEHTARRMPLLSALRDPHTARIFDYVPPESARAIELDHGLILSELVDGRPLSARPLGTQIGPTASVQIIRQICESLAEAHQSGLAHGNLKPSNIVLVDGTDGISVRVLDYGLVPRIEVSGDISDLRRGTRPLHGHPAYIAPECILLDAALSERTDIYALGLIFYELLTGENPMRRGSTSAMLRRQVDHVPPPVSGSRIGSDLSDLIASMVAKQPELRPSSVVQVQQILTSLDLKPGSGKSLGRRTITGSHSQVSEQFAEAYTEVVDDREGMRSEIERARTLTAQARRQAQRWRTLALAGFTLAAVCLIALVFMVLQAPRTAEPVRRSPTTVAPVALPSTAARSAASMAPIDIPDAQPMDAAVDATPPSVAPPSVAPPSAAPPTAPVTDPAPIAPASAAPPTQAIAPEPDQANWPAAPAAPAIALVDIARAPGGRLYAARSEVTRTLWQSIMGGNDAGSTLPATRMTYAEVLRFLNRLSKREGLTACYDGGTPVDDCAGYRLPTEAEWLKIARFAHPSGPPPRSGARYWKHGLKGPAPVCSSGVARGLCDVYGNVWEWTSTGSRKARIRRGGSWMHTRKDAKVKVRHGVRKRAPYLGLRPIRIAKPAPFEFGGVQIDPLGRTVSAGDDEPVTLAPAAAAILFDGLRAKGGVVALPELGERTELELPALRAGADALRTALDQLGQPLRAAPAGADGVRLILKP